MFEEVDWKQICNYFERNKLSYKGTMACFKICKLQELINVDKPIKNQFTITCMSFMNTILNSIYKNQLHDETKILSHYFETEANKYSHIQHKSKKHHTHHHHAKATSIDLDHFYAIISRIHKQNKSSPFMSSNENDQSNLLPLDINTSQTETLEKNTNYNNIYLKCI